MICASYQIIELENLSEKSTLKSFVGFALFIFVLGVLGQWLNDYLSWDRSAIVNWQIWRLFSGHLVHSNLWHTLLNLSVFSAAMYLFGSCFKAWQWLLLLLVLCVLNSFSLLVFSPWLNNYVGLSGVLYGVLILGLLITFRQSPKLNVILILLISIKIVWEQLPGFDVNYMRDQIGAAVIVDAHLYGYVSGFFIYIVIWIKRKMFGTYRQGSQGNESG